MSTFALIYIGFLFFIISDQTVNSDFGDLGRQLLAGFLIAVALAVLFTIVKMRWRNQNPPAKFISIRASDESEIRHDET